MFQRTVNTSLINIHQARCVMSLSRMIPYRVPLSPSIPLSTRIVLDTASHCTGSVLAIVPLFPSIDFLSTIESRTSNHSNSIIRDNQFIIASYKYLLISLMKTKGQNVNVINLITLQV